MLFQNEHSARIINPDKFKENGIKKGQKFARKNISKGVDIIIGKLKDGDGGLVTQTYRFDKKEFTVTEAKKWLKDNDVDYISFEKATKAMIMESNIYIIGEITDIKDENIKTPQYTLSDALAAYQRVRDFDVINLWISSPGGYVKEGTQIAELFKNSGKLIKTHNLGDVASIAFDIFLAAKRENRYYYPEKGRLLIHYPWGEVAGNADELQEYTELLRDEEKILVKNLSKELSVDEAVLRGYMEQERFLTTEEVALLNIANIVKQEFKAVAKLKFEKMDVKEVKEELSGIKKALEAFKAFFKPKALMIQDVNGVELDMPEIETFEQLAIGIAINVAGSPGDGENTLEDGTVIKSETGKITEIILPSAGAGDEMEALKAENEALKKQLTGLQTSAKEKETEIVNFKIAAKAKIEEVTKKQDAFMAKFSTEFVPAGDFDDSKEKNAEPKKFAYRGKKIKK